MKNEITKRQDLKITKIKDIVKLLTTSIVPLAQERYHLYSLPSFDNGQTREELLGAEIQSNKYIVPDKCILFNKLNVRFKRVWCIDNHDANKICSTEFLPLVVDETKVDYSFFVSISLYLNLLRIVYADKTLTHQVVINE